MNEQTRSFLDTIVHKKAFETEKSVDAKLEVSEKKTTSGKHKTKTEKSKENFKYKEHRKYKIFSGAGIFSISVLFIFLVIASAFLLYGHYYQGKSYLGVYVMGENVGAKSEKEIIVSLDRKIKNFQLDIKDGNDSFQAGFADLGISFNTGDMAKQAVSYGRSGNYFENILAQAKGYLSQYKIEIGKYKISVVGERIEPVHKVDQNKLSMYLSEIEEKMNIQAKDSVISTVGSKVQIAPAVFGKKIETARLKEKLLTSAFSFSETPINVSAQVISPNIVDEKTKTLALEAEMTASKKIQLTYEEKKFVPSKETVMSWITFSRENDKSEWKMTVDPARMYGYFDTIGTGINIWPVVKKVRVENGSKETVTQEGSDGLLIDKARLGQSISSGLLSQSSVTLPIPMYVAPYKTEKENILVANWEKYIDVNLSTQTMCAYLAGGIKVNCWLITTGATGLGYNTPVGTHLIRSKSGEGGYSGGYEGYSSNGTGVCMPNPPKATKLCGINYVSNFTAQGHAIHEAWWRSVFGVNPAYSGSHGCVNVTYDIAKFVYYWAPIGTPVVIHY